MNFTELLSKYGIDTLIIALLTVVATGLVKLPLKWLAEKFKSGKKITRFITFLPLFTGFGATVLVNLLLKHELFFGQALYVQWLTSVSLSLAIYAFWEKFVPSEKKILSAAALEENREAVERLKQLLTENQQTPQETSLTPDAEQTQTLLKKNFNQGVKKMGIIKLNTTAAQEAANVNNATGANQTNDEAATTFASYAATTGKSCQTILTPETEGLFEFESSYSPGGGGEDDVYPGCLEVDCPIRGQSETAAVITVDLNKIPKINGTIQKAVLQITTKQNAVGCFCIYNGGNPRENPIDAVPEKLYEQDVTDWFMTANNYSNKLLFIYLCATIKSGQTVSTEVKFYTEGANSPKLILTYIEDTSDGGDGNDYNTPLETPNYKEFSFGSNTKGYLNINSGDLTTVVNSTGALDLAVPMQVNHVHRLGAVKGNYGLNWRLNLDKKLKLAAEDNTTNTVYAFTDEFGDSYKFNEVYYYLNDGQKVFVNKNLVEIDLNGNLSYNGNKIIKQQTCNGFTFIPALDDFLHVEFLEQRQSEQAELENTVMSYKTSIENLVVYDYVSGNIHKEMDENFTIQSFTEFKNIGISQDYYVILPETDARQLMSLSFNLKQIIDQLKDSNLAESQKESLQKQLEQIDEQIGCTVKQAKRSFPQIEENVKLYFNKKHELELLKRQTPVCYLKDDEGLIYGFNESGDFACVFDGYGNYVSIVRDDNGKIIGLTDNNEKSVVFSYENDVLKSINDDRGRKVEYSYIVSGTTFKLSAIKYADGTGLSFKYDNDKMGSVEENLVCQAKINYASGKLSGITKKGLFNGSGTVSETSVTYTDNGISLHYDKGCSESFKFYESGRVKTHEEIDEIGVKTTVDYSYNKISDGKIITTVTKSDVHEQAKTVTKQYDNSNSLANSTEEWYNISDNVSVRTVTEYEYDEDDKPKSKLAYKYYKNAEGEETTVTKTYYRYNTQGSLILTESYVQGEEDISGKNYERRVYGKNGNVIKTICWNSLDPSAKFYSESVSDEKGCIIGEKDETGALSAEYEYVDGTNVINSVKYADGSKLAYGRDPFNDTVTSVTSSTADGEKNACNLTYNRGKLVKAENSNTVIEYGYDFAGRKNRVTLNGAVQSTTSYGKYSRDEATETCDYGEVKKVYKLDGKDLKVVKSRIGNIDEDTSRMHVHETLTIGSDKQWEKCIDSNGRLQSLMLKTPSGDRRSDYSYDKYDNLTQVTMALGGVTLNTESLVYNDRAELVQKTFTASNLTQTYTYEYKDTLARSLDNISIGGYKFKPLNDVNGRDKGKEIYSGTTKIAAEYISYRQEGDRATGMPSAVWYGSGSVIKDSVKYKYDKRGNICEVTENGHLAAKYLYDTLGRLVREDNKQLGKTVLYSYDTNGNITERCEYAYTGKRGEKLSTETCRHYSYDYNGDKLVSYDGAGISYNTLGSPTVYRGKSASWQHGKLLTGYNGVTFGYDGLGRRIKKNSVEYTYDNDGRLIKQSDGLEYVYDADGVIGVKYNNTQYFYRRDAQGNIVAILSASGAVVAKYIYDAWGNHAVVDANGNDIDSATHIGNKNPFRYNGYYYDVETGFYYLQTRYYDPEVGRFISQDSIDYADPETINGLNLYAYCGNNPVTFVDATGHSKIKKFFRKIGKAFTDAGKAIKDFFVDDVYGEVLKPFGDWVSNEAIPAIGQFFTDTIPDFFTNTVPDFFTNTIPDFFTNTVWNDWIVDKVWNKGLRVAWDWLINTKAGQITSSAIVFVTSIIGLIFSAAGCITPASPIAIGSLVVSVLGAISSFGSLMVAIFS